MLTLDAARSRPATLFRAILFAVTVVIALPVSAAAADAAPDATPSPSATEGPSPTPSPSPTSAPTATPEPTPSPTGTPPPTGSPTPTPVPTPGIRSLLFYRANTVVRQYDRSWCVAAATQTMWNILRGESNARYVRQHTLYKQIRAHNRYRYRTLGNDVEGWAWALRRYTGRPYQAYSLASKSAAIVAIADRLAKTGHPVGITVQHGRHAWIVLGYKAREDPADPSKRTIIGFYVSGPLGAGSSDPWKYKYMSVATFRRYYGSYHESQRKVVWEGRYVWVSD